MKSRDMPPVPGVAHNRYKRNRYGEMDMRKGCRDWNTGSAVIEVTLIMSMVLLVIMLLLTMLLGEWKQAETHADMMLCLGENQRQPDDRIETETHGERIIYSQNVNIELAQGYAIEKTEYQIERKRETEQRLRRWQLLGDILSD